MILLVLLLLGSTAKGQQLPCGSTPITQSRVIGGQNARPGAWPWQIALKRYGRFICGGSLISADWVITAAHCVAGSSNPANYKIVVGEHDRNTNEGTEQELSVRRIISHPSYNRPSRLNNDIALMQLSTRASLSQRVNPICLPNHDSDIPTGSKCYITGWGKIRHPGSSYHILQQAMIPPVDAQKCRRKIQAAGVSITLTRQMLCAGVDNTILSGCHGDSGGPYVCLNADRRTYTLHGAVSWGSGTCNARTLYTVFARVTQFRAWIKTNTGLGGSGGGSPPPPPSPPIPTTPAGNLVFSCTFNGDLCGFTQSRNDEFDWTQKSGSTSSSQTGPSGDVSGNGKYMYIETSSPRVSGDKARLEKSGLSFSTKKCLSFYYHMYGSSMGTLNVLVGSRKVFTKNGNQGNQWFKASVAITDPGASKLVFEGIRGSSFRGDAAIDNVELRECGGGGGGGGGGGCGSTTSPPPVSTPAPFDCNFDTSTCGFVQALNDDFNWSRRSGRTPSSSTGPSSGHGGRGYYMYIETSSPRQPGDSATLNAPQLPFSGQTCVTFFYHMYGAAIGNLSVRFNGREVFSASGNKGNVWLKASLSLNLNRGYTLSFTGVRGRDYTGDIALDDFSMRASPCVVGSTTSVPITATATPTPPPFSCDFESSSICGFLQSLNDKFNWTRKRGGTPSGQTGPSFDHTTGNAFGHYMYIETSYPRKLGDYAILNSPSAQRFRGNMCLRFFYHMYGGTIGSLGVKFSDKNVFYKSGNQGNKWLKAEIDVKSSTGMNTITFLAKAGSSYTGDIAIDDVSLIAGSCSSMTPPPPSTPSPPGSCGVRPQTRIVGGTQATSGSWPWQAMLRYPSGFQFCGGTLVAYQWVVTATHCVTGKQPGSFNVRLGAHSRTQASTGYEQDFSVSKIITHPSYHSPKRYSHDIALLKLSRPATLNSKVNLACLPSVVSAPTDGTRCWITGWGRLASGGATPNYLMQASVPIASRSRCDRAYPNKIHDSMICAGLDQGGIDTCQGDSGGPMVCETGGRYYLHGVTSWGYGCASPGKFGVYAKVTYLMNWLTSEMGRN